MKSVLMVGLDGATWDLIKPWIDEDKLPNLKKLMKSGSYGTLKSTTPPISPAAWTTIATGKNPGKHGVFDFFNKDGTLVSSKDVKCKRIWNFLDMYGFKCCIINYPFTYPPEEISGYMISDFTSPPEKKDIAYPKRLLKLLKKIKYKREIEFEKFGLEKFDDANQFLIRDKILKEIYNVMHKRFELADTLVKSERWGLFLLIIKESDETCHLFWDRKDVLLKFFQELDKELEKLISNFKKVQKDFNTIIVSDHGFGLAQEIGVNLYPIMKKYNLIDVSFSWKLISKFTDFGTVKKVIERASKSWKLRKMFRSQQGSIGIKLWGISLDDKNNVDKLVKILKNLKYKSEDVFVGVWKNSDIYKGEHFDKAPDIVYLLNPKYKPLFLPSNKIFVNSYSTITGDHFSYPNGIFIINGNDFKKNFRIDARVADIAPTILHIFNLPVSKDMDGKVLEKIFTSKRKVKISKLDISKVFDVKV